MQSKPEWLAWMDSLPANTCVSVFAYSLRVPFPLPYLECIWSLGTACMFLALYNTNYDIMRIFIFIFSVSWTSWTSETFWTSWTSWSAYWHDDDDENRHLQRPQAVAVVPGADFLIAI